MEKIPELEKILNTAAADLPKVTEKKMFGCHALFANQNVFAMVWKKGQIGVKLTKTGDYEKLMAFDGAQPWTAGPRKMAHWILLPESLQAKPKSLLPWLKLAHAQALKADSKPKKPAAVKRKKSKIFARS